MTPNQLIYSVSTKNKANYFQHSVIKPQAKRSIFWHCESAYDYD